MTEPLFSGSIADRMGELAEAPKHILDVAKALVTGDRSEQYGDMVICHRNIASLWSAYLGINISPRQCALMLALMKIARTKSGHNPDNYVDLAGYAAVAAEIAERAPDERKPVLCEWVQPESDKVDAT